MPKKSLYIRGARTKLPLLEDAADIDEYLSVIKDNLLYKENLTQALREQLKNAKDEAYKDKELAAAHDEIKKMNEKLSHSFEVTKDEWDAIHKWQQQHGHGNYVYEFYPTSIGTIGTCYCATCRDKARNLATSNHVFDRELYKKLLKEYDVSFDFQELW